MTAAFALHLHGEYRLVCVRCFCWKICRMAAIEWRLDGGSDLGRCCNYEMAVWERKGEDKAVWREAAGKRTEF
jgi:hypothetical protein